jgi:hypothetical protein
VAVWLVLVRAGPFNLIGARGPRAAAEAKGLVAAIAAVITRPVLARTASRIASLLIFMGVLSFGYCCSSSSLLYRSHP